MKTVIRSLATANPPMYVTQREVFDYYEHNFDLTPEALDLYRRILLDETIRGRYIGMDAHDEALETNPDRLVERFRKFGTLIAAQAARRAVTGSGYRLEDLNGLVVNTCTGYLCPGLSSYLAEELGLKSSVRVLDLMGMGCGAAIPNLESAAGLLARGMEGPVLSLAVEVCSATLYMGSEPDLVVSNCIFGDGASAAVLDGERHNGAPILAELVDFESAVFPDHREHLRYRTRQGRLRNVLSRRVPVVGANAVSQVTERLLGRNGLDVDGIHWWAVHAGGTAVLKQVGKKLGLTEEALRFSYGVFREFGNMSSPTVMFVLRRILDEGRPRPGDRGLLLSFGAGFTAFGALAVF